MGQLTGRNHDDEASQQLGGAGQGLWLETCTRCGRPLTIVAAEAPQDPVCEACAATDPG